MDPNLPAIPPDDLIVSVTPAVVMIAGLAAAIVQFIKAIPQVAKFKAALPFAAIVTGIVLSFVWQVADPIQAGIVAGLIAAGGYDVLKLPTK